MAEYTVDELADWSDDEKRLKKATERKALKHKRKRVEPSPKPARSRVNSGQVPPLLATTPSAVAAKHPAGLPVPLRPVGPCFACGEMGHLRSYCPKTATPENRKLYPLQAGASKPVVGRGQPLKVNDELGVNSAVSGEGEVVAVDGAGADLDSVARCWEAEAREPGAQVTYVKGRLRERLQFWRDEIKVPASILDTIEGGMCCPSCLSQPHSLAGTTNRQAFMPSLCGRVLPTCWLVIALRRCPVSHLFVVPCP